MAYFVGQYVGEHPPRRATRRIFQKKGKKMTGRQKQPQVTPPSWNVPLSSMRRSPNICVFGANVNICSPKRVFNRVLKIRLPFSGRWKTTRCLRCGRRWGSFISAAVFYNVFGAVYTVHCSLFRGNESGSWTLIRVQFTPPIFLLGACPTFLVGALQTRLHRQRSARP